MLGGVNLNRGKQDDSNEPLYQQRPLHSSVRLQHQQGAWQTQLTWQWQDSKRRVDPRRLENTTGSYAVLDFSTQWQHGNLTLNLGASNLLDKDYELPLGGVNIAQYRLDNCNGFMPIKAAGRSVNAGLRYNF